MTKIDTCLSTRVSKWHAWLHLVHVQTQKPHVSFLSLLFPVWQPCSSEGRRVAPHQYLPCSLILLLSISGRLVGWAYVLQSSSSCTFCRAIRQVRKLPLLKHYSTGGKRDNWWQRITKALRSPLPLCRKVCDMEWLRNAPPSAFTLPSSWLNITFLPVAYF